MAKFTKDSLTNAFHSLEAGASLAAGAAGAFLSLASGDTASARFSLEVGRLHADAARARKTAPAA